MPRLFRAGFTPLGLTWLLSVAAQAQPEQARIYHLTAADGSVTVLGENHSFIPFTVTLSAELVHMRSSRPLPAKIVLFPAKQPQALTTFTPDSGKVFSYKYHYPYQLGIYTSKPADTSYVYAYPFPVRPGEGMPACSTDNAAIPGNTHPYFFSLPAETPVLAVRDGIVAVIRQDSKHNLGLEANYIVVFHEDGSYARYHNLKRESAVVKIGQRVVRGETLAYSTGGRKPEKLFFNVMYPGDPNAVALPVKFEHPTKQ